MHATSRVPATTGLWGVAISLHPPLPTLAASVTCQVHSNTRYLILLRTSSASIMSIAPNAAGMEQGSSNVGSLYPDPVRTGLQHWFHRGTAMSQQHAKLGLLDGHRVLLLYCLRLTQVHNYCTSCSSAAGPVQASQSRSAPSILPAGPPLCWPAPLTIQACCIRPLGQVPQNDVVMEGKHGTPYIMPDGSGRHLQDYLRDNSLSSGQPRSRSRGKARQWEKTSAPGQQGSAGADPDVALLLRVGREKRRRWLADTLLRKMAGEIGPGAR